MDNEETDRAFIKTDERKFESKFKAITISRGRQGIRLETLYWETLNEMAVEKGVTLAGLIDEIIRSNPKQKNLTSTLRVMCLDWMHAKTAQLRSVASEKMIRSLLYACPVPALSLSSDKRLHAFNQPFLSYISDKFKVINNSEITSQLRLVLDQQIETLSGQLLANGNRPIAVGIALGMDNRRIRGRINAILVPTEKMNFIIGFVLL